MPQLDKYLVFSETFWFIIFFTLSYFIIYYFLVYLIKGIRLRESFAVQLLIQNLVAKQEKLLLHSPLLSITELKLLSENKLKKILPVATKVQKKSINFSSLFQRPSNFPSPYYKPLEQDEEESLIDRFNIIVLPKSHYDKNSKRSLSVVSKPGIELMLILSSVAPSSKLNFDTSSTIQ
jgi:hypothetical protein